MFSCIAKTFYSKIGLRILFYEIFIKKCFSSFHIYIFMFDIFSLVFEWKITEIYSIQKTRRNFNSNWGINSPKLGK